MKAMLVSDLIVMRRYLIQQSAVGLVLGVVLAFVMENPYVIMPLIGVMVSVTCAFIVLALDERNGWERYRLALPLSRANVVVGRYASLGIVVLIGFAVGLAATAVTVALASALMAMGYGSEGIRAFTDGIVWDAYVLAGVMGLLLVAFMLAITLPLALRFGMTKAVRFIPIAVVVIVLVAFAASGASDALHIAEFFGNLFASPSGLAAFTAGGVGIAIVLYAASAAVAAKLYEAREL